jgi:PAS domain S-box-containing protein
VVGALLDLTEHRDAKREMERALDHLQAILDSSLVGVALVRDRIMVNANRRAEEMFGYDPGELQGCPARILHFSTEQHQAFQDAAERDILEHGAFSGERLLRRKDGSAIWCRMHARPMRRQGLEGGVLWTMDDFTERKVMEDELLAAKEAAEAANHAKTRFLANMSHELRTPLNAVTGLTDMLLSSDLPEEQREMAATIQDATSQLLTVLSDILDYARLDTEEVELEETPFDLNALLRRIEREIRPRAQLKGLDLAIEAPEGLLGFVGDKQRLRQILLGLLGNAIKFTDQGSVALRVDIQEEAEPDAALVNFAVEDTGVGIPEAELDRIFEVFHQGDESSTRRYGGAGIGLAICRRLVHLMGGTIIPLSQAGRGSTFFVTVPLAQASPEQIRQLETQNLAEEASLEQDAQRPLSILLAEDNLVNRQVLVKLLSRRGHSTSVAVNGREAVVMLEGAPFDLVLMDIQMPEMDGLAATRAIRGHEDPRVAATPIVALTAHAMRGDRERFLEAGMDEYVPKPVNPTELEAALATALGQAPPRPAGPPAEAPDDSGLPVLDVDLALERLDHDHAFLEEMFQLYLEDAPVRIQELHAAHQEGRLRDAGDLAHSLKGISHSVGAARLAELAYSLEQAGRGGDLEGFENRLKELSQVYESTAEAIRVKREQGDGP